MVGPSCVSMPGRAHAIMKRTGSTEPKSNYRFELPCGWCALGSDPVPSKIEFPSSPRMLNKVFRIFAADKAIWLV